MTQQYLIGELSAHLGDLRDAVKSEPARDIFRLQCEVENGPLTALAPAARRAIALADLSCWESLTRGDIAGFCEQARVGADLRLFGVCALLLTDD
ncbi:MAG TPA: hypothetical protein VME44_13865 [Streptosporangiaceae bacterium]|jgi:hypothetical protein|nr:hypothetical protein [Streptosporangiaceae bacterium]